MRFGIVGLGRMGRDLALQALDKGHEVVAYNRSPEKARALAENEGAEAAEEYHELAQKLEPPRVVFTYVPHGKPTDDVLEELARVLEEGDVVVDGGNSHWKESQRHHAEFAERGIGFVDAGTSGGVEGARSGACFMVGGQAEHVRLAEPVFRDLSVKGGYLHVGPPGSGHFVKLVHNAIEFAMVQAIGEGVEMVARSEYDVDLADLMHCWANGSVIRSWLVELMERGLRENPDLDALSDYVEDTKEGKWYVQYALEREVYAPVLTLSEMMFYRYREKESIAAKSVALIRHGFGGHPLHRKGEAPDDDS